MKKKWFKVLVDGKSCHGGRMQWSLPKNGKPGEWHEVNGKIRICSNGLHFTSSPIRWWKSGASVYEVEIDEIIDTDDSDDKCVAGRARLTRELSDEELFEHFVFRSGQHDIRDGNAIASGSATVKAFGSATVKAFDSATVRAFDSATVRASDSATVKAFGSATVKAFGSATVLAFDSATVKAYDSSNVEATGHATVNASGSATVKAFGSSTVWASGSATVVSTIWSSAKVDIKDLAVHVDRRSGSPKIYVLDDNS